MSQPKMIRRRRLAAACLEAMEPRQLMSVNAWKSGVSGDWADATKWSLGHVPTTSEDVVINAAGNYTVSVSGYAYAKKVTVGGGTGTQTLAANKGSLTAYGSVSVLAGDAISVNAGGQIYSYASGTTAVGTIDGTITINGSSAAGASFNVGATTYGGTGSVVFNTTTTYATSNQFGGYGGTIGSGITVRGKTGYFFGRMTNKGAIKVEGTSVDKWQISGVDNQGSITSASGAAVQFDFFKNGAGKTVSLTGGSATFYYDFVNGGTLAANGTKIRLASTILAGGLGTFTRVNAPVEFSGYYDGGGKAFAFDAVGKWVWKGGQLKNGVYDHAAANALSLDPAAGAYGSLSNVTLANDVSIGAGAYLSAYGNVTLATGKRIILNGVSGKSSGLYLYGSTATLGGNGEVVFNTSGGTSYNVLGGNAGVIGSGITVRGKTGTVQYCTNNGLILADAAGETIETVGVTNNGNVMATAGTVKAWTYKQTASGMLTIGIGGATSFGKVNFADYTNASVFAGTINAVLLNGYLPAAGATFNVATFAKAATGTFATQNLDAGNGKAFDLTQTATALSLKAKAAAANFAGRSGTSLAVNGTSAVDAIGLKQNLGVLFATVNGKTSVFHDGQLTAATIRAGASNDTVTVSGQRGVSIFGEAGNDTIQGGGGNDSLTGGDGNDLLVGNSGSDVYAFGNAAIAETDTVGEAANLGTGDTLDFSAATVGVTVNLASDTLATMTNRTVKTQAAGQWANLENATGGTAADKLTGNAAVNVLRGGAGNDTLTGAAGADSLYGDAGTDSLFGGGDNVKDLLDGGLDTDVKGSADAIDTLVSVP